MGRQSQSPIPQGLTLNRRDSHPPASLLGGDGLGGGAGSPWEAPLGF